MKYSTENVYSVYGCIRYYNSYWKLLLEYSLRVEKAIDIVDGLRFNNIMYNQVIY